MLCRQHITTYLIGPTNVSGLGDEPFTDGPRFRIHAVKTPHFKPYEGKRIEDLGKKLRI